MLIPYVSSQNIVNEGPPVLALQDNGLSLLFETVTDPLLINDQIEAAVNWTAAAYPPVVLGVFTIHTICN